MSTDDLTYMDTLYAAIAGIEHTICGLLLDDPNDPTIPQMLDQLREWREEEENL